MMYGIYDKGIYGIYVDDELIYVGLTYTCFSKRFQYHSEKLNSKYITSQKALYEYMRQALSEGKKVQMRPIIALQDLTMSDHVCLTLHDLEVMEMTTIALYRPKLNVVGLVTNYKFTPNGKDQIIFACSRRIEGYEKPLLESNWNLYFALQKDEDCLNFN